jgi:hypothetical protein
MRRYRNQCQCPGYLRLQYGANIAAVHQQQQLGWRGYGYMRRTEPDYSTDISMSSSCDEGGVMQRFLLLLLWLALSLALASCSKSDTTASSNSTTTASTQLNWDQGNWNQTNWQ